MPSQIMNVNQFTSAVQPTLNNLKAHFSSQPLAVSDIIDDEGHQYIDLVMEGGGVLGIALVGYIYVLEQMNIRFLGIGGTSAGSINALLLACLDEIKAPKSELMISHLANLDLFSFVDGDEGARQFIRHLLSNDNNGTSSALSGLFHKTQTGLKATGILDELIQGDLGLNPGKVLHKWLKQVLKTARPGITSTKTMEKHLLNVPTLKYRDGKKKFPKNQQRANLALVAADVSTESKIVFPKMAELYYPDPTQAHPADFVRASISVPFFFHPFSISNIANRIPVEKQADFEANWKQWTGFNPKEDGGWPKKHYFVDGGILSNFPIALFHDLTDVPTAPTFGVKIGKNARKSEIKRLSHLTSAIFNSARHVLDLDFILRHPDYQHLISIIDTGSHHWLDFELSPDAKIDLFQRGAEQAATFLKTFDWQAYKAIRKTLTQADTDSKNLATGKSKGTSV